jgi:RimJ/RimL family protein N-acetyltransferase
VRLRAADDGDRWMLTQIHRPEVTGEWDTFDEPPEEMLRGRTYGGGTMMIELADRTVAGSVSYIQIPYGPNRRSLAWRIGITVLPDYRNRGIGAAAQRLLAEQLLGRSDANRVEADTDVGNLPEQRALERAGFSREGIVRAAQWRAGQWHDRVLYSRLRSDP